MNTIDKLDSALKIAMRTGDELRKRTVRMVKASIKNEEINKGRLLDETEVLGIIQKEIKIRAESIEGARQGGRMDLIKDNEAEAAILREFLPGQISDDELRQIVQAAISQVGASGISDMGKVMKSVLPQIQGRAPNDRVSQMVRSQLSA
ncbi:MAG: GatB/YqeY domain-containing protein [Anaerolineaceae bacterium]|jgi:uncharacterized protein YqeY